MSLRNLLSLAALLLFLSTIQAAAQDAITFADFAARVDPYFAPELVADIKETLPQAPFDVWGYDVGDYSSDGNYDVALVIRMKNDTRRRMQVYFFVDDEGVLLPVKQINVDFVVLPIEVGVAISDGTVHMTRKLKEFQWEILGYRFKDGVMMMVDRFTTDRQGEIVHETLRNFQTLEGYQRYINVSDNAQLFRSDFLTTPSYTRGRDVSTGYRSTAVAHQARYIARGSYYWKGEADLRLEIRSAFDSEFLYLNMFVRDDEVVPIGVDGIDTTADRLEVWLDMFSSSDRFRLGRRTRDFRMKTDSNIYSFTITLGDFMDQQARVKPSSANILDEQQTIAAKRIKAVSVRQDSGYAVKLRIPFAMLGFATAPVDDSTLVEFGLTTVVHDVDNPYRPAETTTITTSQNFDRTKPASFGALVLVPNSMFYGESVNIFLGDLKERLDEVGF
jgi:hypothetical protein